MKLRLLWAYIMAVCITVKGQPISGIINDYAPVKHLDTSGCIDFIVIDTPVFCHQGDTLLILQMQGATVKLTNNASFGRITSYGHAGNYEYVIVRQVHGDTVYTMHSLKRGYDVAGKVQLISVPYFRELVITDTLRAKPWDGKSGGVVVFRARKLWLQGVIDASGCGFRGGRVSLGSVQCDFTDYYVPYSHRDAGMKGEGISLLPAGYEAGRGAVANGGGGGNNSNSGGGGGSNGGIGGHGGRQYAGCGSLNVGGIGGYALDMAGMLHKVFAGGGGGGGQQNDHLGTGGANGGGIIIIDSREILSSNGIINADGASQDSVAGRDGAGGGGGGGSVLIHADTLVGNLTVSARGGDGGDVDNAGYAVCHGPGGGGGGGIVWFKSNLIPSHVRIDVSGGAGGEIINLNALCYGDPYGVTHGAPGDTLFGLKLSLPDTSRLCLNHAPVAVTDFINGRVNVPVRLNLLANDHDPDGDRISSRLLFPPSHGHIQQISGDSLLYIPDSAFVGFDTATYIICDDAFPILCDTGEIIIAIAPNAPPVAVGDTFVVEEGDTILLSPLMNDYDPDGDSLQLISITGSEGGIIIADQGDWYYTPGAGYRVYDTLRYTVCDDFPHSLCDSAAILMQLVHNYPPVARDDTVVLFNEDSASIKPLYNDTDANDSILRITGYTQPQYGVAVSMDGRTIIYHPDSQFTGEDTIIYTVCDSGHLLTKCDSAVIFLKILRNNKPFAIDDTVYIHETDTTVWIDVQFNDIEPDGQQMFTSIYHPPGYGTVTVVNLDSLLLTIPNVNRPAADSIGYVVCDDYVFPVCDSGIVRIIYLTNPPPEATVDTVTIRTSSWASLLPLNNDQDPDGGMIYLQSYDAPSYGRLHVVDDTFYYKPFVGMTGVTDTVEYSICDDDYPVKCSSGRIIIRIELPARPVAQDDTFNISNMTPVSLAVMANDNYANRDSLRIEAIDVPSVGQLHVIPDSAFIFFPDAASRDTLRFRYRLYVFSQPALDDTAFVMILPRVNHPPIAMWDAYYTNVYEEIECDPLGNDFDPDGDSLGIIHFSLPEHGDITTAGKNCYYLPDSGFAGIDTVVYIVCDDAVPSACDTAGMVIHVQNNLAVYAHDDVDSMNVNSVIAIYPASNDFFSANFQPVMSLLDTPRLGTVQIAANRLNYTSGNASGNEKLRYRICDRIFASRCDSAYIFITIRRTMADPEIIIPNVFTPNYDGDNDRFIIQGLEQFPDNRLVVYNRWGGKVLEASPYQNDWEGREGFARPLPDGTYYYHLTVAGKIYYGFITILR